MDDDYVAQLMAKEAAENSKKYSLEGLGAYQSQKRSVNAPKANTRFLRHLIKETDSHNTALKRKEERDARDRMRQMKALRGYHQLLESMKENVTLALEPRTDPTGTIVDITADAMTNGVTRIVPTGKATAIAVVRHPRAGTEAETGIGTADIGEETTTAVDHEIPIKTESVRHDGETTIETDQGREVETKSTETVAGQRLTEGEHTQSLAVAPHVEIEVLNLTAADVIINLPPMPGHPHRAGKRSDGHVEKINRKSGPSIQRHDREESDPLEDVVGPLPPQTAAPVRSRGRGAYKANLSNIDSHFAPDYDPMADIQPDDDQSLSNRPTRRPVAGLETGEDDWDMALEALRDRARWKQKGEERLREAGLNETIIERWKDNTTSAGASGEKRPEDVRWSKKGEGREWDRGKVVDDQGHTDVHASW
ncbi:hypothetical protein N7481_012407 [Penicillium waksmanii]|uniref:uncharacterized protein n=1 Tax=Penicillium waksmanii TaxID=69791 RepID=UPI0025471BF5|nr:uncharacterized protein N7481_012407 [Penicillium waksmanii]KAJ5965693.1 hypothetical protein N7481_012407 [Penicillium waksmanii]